MKRLFLFLALLPLTSIAAQASPYGELIVPNTDNGCFNFSGHFDPQVTIAAVRIVKDGHEEYYYSPNLVADGIGKSFQDVKCVKGGAGKYDFKLLLSVKPAAPSGGYFYEPEEVFQAENTGTEKFAEFNVQKETSNSCFELSGRFLPNVDFILITGDREGRQEFQYTPNFSVDDSGYKVFRDQQCVKDGPGDYRVNLQVVAKGSRTVAYDKTVYVTNLDDVKYKDYLAPSMQVESTAPEIQMTAQAILEGTRTTTEKVRAIHDWVARNVSYDVDGYFADLEGNQEKSYRNKSLDALSVFKSRVAVCNGYARLTVALLRAAGIPARVVTGVANFKPLEWTAKEKDPNGPYSHAWVEYDLYGAGEWQAMDPTWDAGVVNFTEKKFKFLFTPMENLAPNTHIKLADENS